MSFLAELKKEAKAKKENSVSPEKPAAAPQVSENIQAVQPRMHALRDFLTELAEQLEVIQPELSITYEVPGFGVLANLRQGGYEVVCADGDIVRKVSFQFGCRGGAPILYSTDSRDEFQFKKEQLDEYKLDFRCKSEADWRFVFTVASFVPISFEFEAQESRPAIRLVVRNLDVLGAASITFEPEQLSQELLEEFAKRVVRKSNRFDELSGNRVSNEMRKQFQEKIAERQRERAAQLKNPLAAVLPAKKKSLFQDLFGRKTADNDPAPGVEADDELPPDAGMAAPAVRTQLTNKYTWMVAGDPVAGDTSSSLGKIGPTGAKWRASIKSIIAEGEHFRLRDGTGAVCFTGYIVGEYTGLEPLDDFGKQKGCVDIEFERAGKWVRVDSAA